MEQILFKEVLKMERREEVLYCVKGNVKLKNGEWLEYSDKLRIQGVIANNGDIAVIHDFPKRSVVVDILKKGNDVMVSDEELQKQMKRFHTLQGGY